MFQSLRTILLPALLATLSISVSAAPKKRIPEPDPNRFLLRKHSIEIPERGNVPGFLLLTASNRFEFIHPDGFSARVDQVNRSVTLASRDGRCQIGFQLSTNFTDQLPAPLVLRSYATNLTAVRGCKLVGDRHAYTGSGRGHALDFQRRSGSVIVHTRLLFVPLKDTCAVFTIRTVGEDQHTYRYRIGDFLSSFLREKVRLPSR